METPTLFSIRLHISTVSLTYSPQGDGNATTVSNLPDFQAVSLTYSPQGDGNVWTGIGLGPPGSFTYLFPARGWKRNDRANKTV